jgi:signal transduction histidine kinase
VLLNVFLNALQAMPNGGELRIRARDQLLGEPGRGIGLRTSDVFRVGDRALICEIQDTGVGIPKELLSRVFNPFFTTKAPGEGVGLGLSITQAIIHAHRGLITLDSEPGKGTTVTIMLPISG